MAALATHVRHAVGKALRETGSAMERAGMALGGDQSFWDHASRHTTTVSFADAQPCIAPDSCVASSATIYGAASVGAKATVGAGAVVFGPSVIGDGAVVGANSVCTPTCSAVAPTARSSSLRFRRASTGRGGRRRRSSYV